MMNRHQTKKAQAAFDSDHSIGRRRIVKITGCSNYAADKFLASRRAGNWDGKGQPSPATPPNPQGLGVSIKDFASRFDYESSLRNTVKRLCHGRFVADADVRTESGMSPAVFRTTASLPEFAACQIKDSGVTWWSTKENVDSVRAQARKWGVNK